MVFIYVLLFLSSPYSMAFSQHSLLWFLPCEFGSMVRAVSFYHLLPRTFLYKHCHLSISLSRMFAVVFRIPPLLLIFFMACNQVSLSSVD